MLAAGSATESMARGGGGGGHGGGGHDGGGSHSGDHGGGGHGFGGGDHGMGRGFGVGDYSFGDRSQGRGMFGSSGIFGGERGHDRFDGRRDHFRNFPRDDSYGFREYPSNSAGCN